MTTDLKNLKHRSRIITEGMARSGARAMLRAVGLNDEDLHNKPLVAIANTWIEANPCTVHLLKLAEKVKEGVRAAGGVPLEFSTVSVSDGISMGTEAMRCSLVSLGSGKSNNLRKRSGLARLMAP